MLQNNKAYLLDLIISQRDLFILNRVSLHYSLDKREDFLKYSLTLKDKENRVHHYDISHHEDLLKNNKKLVNLTREHEVSAKRQLFNSVYEFINHYVSETNQKTIFTEWEIYPYFYIMRVFGSHYLKDRDLTKVQEFLKKGIKITWRSRIISNANEANIQVLNMPDSLLLIEDVINFVETKLR